MKPDKLTEKLIALRRAFNALAARNVEVFGGPPIYGGRTGAARAALHEAITDVLAASPDVTQVPTVEHQRALVEQRIEEYLHAPESKTARVNLSEAITPLIAVACEQQHAATIRRLTDGLEDERLRLAACTAAALGNTEKAVHERLGREHPYWSATYSDVCHVVDAEIEARERAEAAEAELARLRAAQAWRPIETALKDDDVLLYQEGWGVRAGYWDDLDPNDHFWFAVEAQGVDGERMKPTLWQPLPAPPLTGHTETEK